MDDLRELVARAIIIDRLQRPREMEADAGWDAFAVLAVLTEAGVLLPYNPEWAQVVDVVMTQGEHEVSYRLTIPAVIAERKEDDRG